MLKKLFFIFFCAAAACLLLPLCFGLWSEDLTVGAHITVATPEPSFPACCAPAAETEPAQSDSGAEETDEAPYFPEGTADAETGPEDGQSDSNGGEADSFPETPAPEETEEPAESGGGESAASVTEAP